MAGGAAVEAESLRRRRPAPALECFRHPLDRTDPPRELHTAPRGLRRRRPLLGGGGGLARS
eukprot:scaffold123692_cov28-Tisochrysis_lutea.AAC.2